MSTDPDLIRKRAEAVRRRFDDPAYRAKMTRIVKSAGEEARKRPEYMQRLRERGADLAKLMNSPEVTERRLAKRHVWGAKYTELRLGWCPVAYRDEYRRLRSSGNKGAAAAKEIILVRIAQATRAEAERVAALSPFERQMHAITQGARLIEKPVYHSRPYDFTLGGVSSMEGA